MHCRINSRKEEIYIKTLSLMEKNAVHLSTTCVCVHVYVSMCNSFYSDLPGWYF